MLTLLFSRKRWESDDRFDTCGSSSFCTLKLRHPFKNRKGRYAWMKVVATSYIAIFPGVYIYCEFRSSLPPPTLRYSFSKAYIAKAGGARNNSIIYNPKDAFFEVFYPVFYAIFSFFPSLSSFLFRAPPFPTTRIYTSVLFLKCLYLKFNWLLD